MMVHKLRLPFWLKVPGSDLIFFTMCFWMKFRAPKRDSVLALRGLINVFYFSENSEYFLDLGKMFPRFRKIKGTENLEK